MLGCGQESPQEAETAERAPVLSMAPAKDRRGSWRSAGRHLVPLGGGGLKLLHAGAVVGVLLAVRLDRPHVRAHPGPAPPPAPSPCTANQVTPIPCHQSPTTYSFRRMHLPVWPHSRYFLYHDQGRDDFQTSGLMGLMQ